MFGFLKKGWKGSPPKDSWVVAQSENDGLPMYLRINEGLRSIAGKAPVDHRFGVAVQLVEPDENGLPSSQEFEELNKIEDMLVSVFGGTGIHHLAVVITTCGFREFVFYTSSPNEVAPELEKLRSRVNSHKIQFYVRPDATWEVFNSFLP